VANEERDGRFVRRISSHDEIAFVLSVLIIGNDDDSAGGNCFDR